MRRGKGEVYIVDYEGWCVMDATQRAGKGRETKWMLDR